VEEIIFTDYKFPLSVDWVCFIEKLSRAVETLENSVQFFDAIEVRDAADNILDVYEQLAYLSQLKEVLRIRKLLKEALDIIETALEDNNPDILEESIDCLNKALDYFEYVVTITGERIRNKIERSQKYLVTKEVTQEDKKTALKIFRNLFMTNMARSLNITTDQLVKFVSELSGHIELIALTHLVAKFPLEKSDKLIVMREDNGLLIKVIKRNEKEIKTHIIPVNETYLAIKKNRVIRSGDMVVIGTDEPLSIAITLTPSIMGMNVYVSIRQLIRENIFET